MKKLAPNLFDRRFKDLMEIGRARLPALAPEWTDHNAHDPGITLMELLAWNTEAQIYSLARMRRDEREAYATLLGLTLRGTRPARGLIWPDLVDPRSPARTRAESIVIRTDAVVNVSGMDAPTFRPAHELLWVPGRLVKLETRLADGRRLDHTAVNERGGPPFLPFGDVAGRRDVLSLRFSCGGDAGLFPRLRKSARNARWSIGVRADPPLTKELAPLEETSSASSTLTAALVVGDERYPIAIESDTTAGFLRTGALLFDLSEVPDSPAEFTLELQAPRGFERPPRVLRIDLNVIPIVQGCVVQEEQTARGEPDWSFQLGFAGLRFETEDEAVRIEVDESTGTQAWTRCDRLSDQEPDARVFELDAASGKITFGNSINGRMPAAGDIARVKYSICDGASGSIARNRTWSVAGFEGVFGLNPDPVDLGADAVNWSEVRRDARQRARNDHALVSSADIASAAMALPLLEVARAWVVPPAKNAPRGGELTLVAMRARPFDKEPVAPPETRRWLEAIRRRLVSRMPLGTRLVVAAPRYVGFFVRAKLEVELGRHPDAVKSAVETELGRRLALVSSRADVLARPLGVPVTRRDVSAWIRAVDGVVRATVELFRTEDRANVEDVPVSRGGLPRFDPRRTTIDVGRQVQGSTA